MDGQRKDMFMMRVKTGITSKAIWEAKKGPSQEDFKDMTIIRINQRQKRANQTSDLNLNSKQSPLQ